MSNDPWAPANSEADDTGFGDLFSYDSPSNTEVSPPVSSTPPDPDDLFVKTIGTNTHVGYQRLHDLLQDPSIRQIMINRHDRVFYTDSTGTHASPDIFMGPSDMTDWINSILIPLTDCEEKDVITANTSIIEGSFMVSSDMPALRGSIHIATKEVTRNEPAVTIRKQPKEIITLSQIQRQGMMTEVMSQFLQQMVRGRANILISGGTGAGKTTLARALSAFIPPDQRVVTVEEIAELYLDDRLPNVVSSTTVRKRDERGIIYRETTLADLVREALRQRGDRIWVGETRGEEAMALIKACNSGHDGSVTTVHADTPKQAIRQLTTYLMESGKIPEEAANQQVTSGFNLVIQISVGEMGKKVISHITELQPGDKHNDIFVYNFDTKTHEEKGDISPLLTKAIARYGVKWDHIRPSIRR